eukprot:1161318-Pelagomonas_calceolata.AAC.5
MHATHTCLLPCWHGSLPAAASGVPHASSGCCKKVRGQWHGTGKQRPVALVPVALPLPDVVVVVVVGGGLPGLLQLQPAVAAAHPGPACTLPRQPGGPVHQEATATHFA